jgi:hypothetical protein
MWLKKLRPQATTHMVEPNEDNIRVGKANFERNNFGGHFEQAFVGHGHFGVDAYMQRKCIDRLDILHSDIQSFEVEMLRDCAQTLSKHAIDYLFISTHTQELHAEVVQILKQHSYNVEVSSDFDFETTSFDGFIFASSPLKERVFKNFQPMSRLDIARSTPLEVVQFLHSAI